MRQSDLKYATVWRLRKRLTDLRKAKEWNDAHPRAGLARLMADSLDDDIARVRAELQRRKIAR